MLSRQVTKLVQNLEKKKFRDKYNLFKVEGGKLVEELLRSGLKIEHVIGVPAWFEKDPEMAGRYPCSVVEEQEMKSISNFASLPEVVALAGIPEYTADEKEVRESLSLVLNGIQDPGNLGTILRVADWFGIRHIFCDEMCASFHNPKCVQASMGSIFRVKVVYGELTALLKAHSSESFPHYGTFLNGENIYHATLYEKGFIVMGNEGKGISEEVGHLIDRRLTIPGFAVGASSPESLNVGVATGIILSEFRRRQAP